MEAILKFDLNDPDDRMAHLRATLSLEISLVLWHILYNSRREFEDRAERYETKEELIEAMYEEFWNIAKEHGVDLDKIIM